MCIMLMTIVKNKHIIFLKGEKFMYTINKKAFTMAEVLVTLMIIGVIGALTIPSLKKHSEIEEHVASLKKAYSSLANATKLVETKYGEIKRWGQLSSSQEEGSDAEEGTPAGLKKVLDNYSKVFNVTKTCDVGESGCWAQTRDLQNSDYGSENNIVAEAVAFKTTDNMNWSFSGLSNSDTYGVKIDGIPGLLVWVDTNGDSKPNMLGYDVFAFVVHPENGVLPAGAENNSPNCKSSGKQGFDCAAKVIKEGKISY